MCNRVKVPAFFFLARDILSKGGEGGVSTFRDTMKIS